MKKYTNATEYLKHFHKTRKSKSYKNNNHLQSSFHTNTNINSNQTIYPQSTHVVDRSSTNSSISISKQPKPPSSQPPVYARKLPDSMVYFIYYKKNK